MKKIKFILALIAVLSLVYCLLPSSSAAMSAASEYYGISVTNLAVVCPIEIAIVIFRLSYYIFRTLIEGMRPLLSGTGALSKKHGNA